MRQTTLTLFFKPGQVLLAMKKRGFGVGRWNGAGGKFDPAKGDRSILDTALREVKEEISIEMKDPEKMGLFRFRFKNKQEWDQDVSLFCCKEWLGEPKESEEMRPSWFYFEDIPYESMWPDDKHWLPHVIAGKKVEADFLFGDNDEILEHRIRLVEKI